MGLEKYRVKKLFEVRPYKMKELTALYEVDPKTLRKWLNDIEAKLSRHKGSYRISEVERIREYYGFPYLIYDVLATEAFDESLIKPFKIKPYKFCELAELYNCHPNTFRREIKPFRNAIGELKGRYFTIPQVEAIIFNLDLPYKVETGKAMKTA
jgi:hypothetical protein